MAIDTNINININMRTGPIDGGPGALRSDKNQGPVEQKTGQGVVSLTYSETPPPKAMTETSDGLLPEPYQEAIDSITQLLAGLENGFAGEEEEVLLAKVAKKLRDINLILSKGTADITRFQREAASADVREIIEKIEEQKAEVERNSKKSKIWGWVKVAFSIVVAIASIALAVCTIGFCAPVCVGAFCMVILAVNDVVAQSTGTSAVGHICKWAGADEELARKIEIAVVVILSVVACVGLCGGPAKCASTASKIGTDAMSAASKAGSVAKGAMEAGLRASMRSAATALGNAIRNFSTPSMGSLIGKMSIAVPKDMKSISSVLLGVGAIGEGAGAIGHAKVTSDAMKLQGKVADNQGDLEDLRLLIEALDQLIKEVLEDQGEAMLVFAENIGKASEGLSKKGDALMHVGRNIGKVLA